MHLAEQRNELKYAKGRTCTATYVVNKQGHCAHLGLQATVNRVLRGGKAVIGPMLMRLLWWW